MKKVYWRPQAASRTALILVAALSVGGLASVEFFKTRVKQPHFDEKLAAASLAEQGMDLIRAERLARGHPIDPEVDPAETGLIGELMTPVTSTTGSLSAKQTAANPNFAAVIVDMLARANVKEGDTVAVGVSGSFPALNICVYAAMETMKLRPLIISSAASSQWGANFPDFLWLDMERILEEKGLTSFRSAASSIGGYEDLGLGMTPQARALIQAAIERNRLSPIEAENFTRSIETRMNLYQKWAAGAPVKAYLNIGGGTVSVGRGIGKRSYEPGLNLRPSRQATRIDSVMTRFAREGIPVIHLIQIEQLARQHGLPPAPERRPAVGDGDVYVRREYNLWLAAASLAAILFCLHAFLLSDLGFRLLRGFTPHEHPQPMV